MILICRLLWIGRGRRGNDAVFLRSIQMLVQEEMGSSFHLERAFASSP